jgi:hypothetical protein
MGVDNYTALKHVSLMITEPRLTQLGSWRLTAVVHVTVATWIGNAAAVLSGTWGAVTRRAHHRGSRRTTVYTHAQRVVQAVTSTPVGGLSYDALWHENERLKAENAALWQAWSEAEGLSAAPEGRQRWTLQLLADRVVALGLAASYSYESVRRVLKKQSSSRG